MIAYACLFNGLLNIKNTLTSNKIFQCLETEIEQFGCPFTIVPCEILKIYKHNVRNMYAQVEIIGIEIVKDDIHYTNKIRIIKFLSYDSLFQLSTGVFKCYNITKHYYNGMLHHDTEPAVIYDDGTQLYYSNNKLHRLNGPAIIYNNGIEMFFVNNVFYKLSNSTKN